MANPPTTLKAGSWGDIETFSANAVNMSFPFSSCPASLRGTIQMSWINIVLEQLRTIVLQCLGRWIAIRQVECENECFYQYP